jgi:hypothetical protein
MCVQKFVWINECFMISHWEQSDQVMTLTTHLHLVPRLRMHGDIKDRDSFSFTLPIYHGDLELMLSLFSLIVILSQVTGF